MLKPKVPIARFIPSLFVFGSLLGCSTLPVVDGKLPESTATKMREFAGAYEGSFKAYGPDETNTVALTKEATLTVAVDETGHLLLTLQPSALEPGCELRFAKLLKVEEVRTRLRGRFSIRAELEFDPNACPKLPHASVTRVLFDPSRDGEQSVEFKILKHDVPQGFSWESESSTFYQGSFERRR